MNDAKNKTEEKSTSEQVRQAAQWCYDSAFSRHVGLITAEEQQKLRQCRVAIPGMGGVGGVHLVTLARLGIGRFTIADPDEFDLANFNRQQGATLQGLGRNKAEVMAELALDINPELDIRVWHERVTKDNVGDFLDGADILLDGIDFFSFDARRMIFREARARGIWGVTAGPVGFSAAWVLYDPAGMSFDEYFDLHDEMAPVDQFTAFGVGLTPRLTQLAYLDLARVKGDAAQAPSAGLACQLCSGVAAVEVLKIVLGRKPLRPAPCYAQFDAYRGILRTGKLRWGNRGPMQRLRRFVIRRRMLAMGYAAERT
jgi:molybdopterin/thiamine biosynthesis adenylyltransferase